MLIFGAMNVIWGLAAMPMMIGAFANGDACAGGNVTACNVTEKTITEEFKLYGYRAYMSDFTSSAFILGNLVGSCFAPPLSDKYGRRTVVVVCMFFFGLYGVACAFAPNVYVLFSLSFLQGTTTTGLTLISWVLCYESAPGDLRIYATLVSGIFWVIGYVSVAPLAYWTANWRQLYVAASAPSLVCSFLFYFITPESFHYLAFQRRREDVERWIATCSRWSRKEGNISVDVDALMEHAKRVHDANHNEDGGKNRLIYELLTNRPLLLYTVVMAYLWSCDGLSYYGVSLFATKLAGNKYMNYVLCGIVELPAYLTLPVVINVLGRRAFTSFTHALTCTGMLITVFAGDDVTLKLCAWLVGKLSIAWAYTASYAYGVELFPTVYRTDCIGICNSFSRFFSVFAPTLRTVGSAHPTLPAIIISSTTGIAAFLTLLLPETKGRELPDGTDEITNHSARERVGSHESLE